ncbi:KH domain-containing protein [Candidatus Daviesbacteria bacterium]|nr:KH domain-containing protein [Candidatus Daviesbacteria bacterium]
MDDQIVKTAKELANQLASFLPLQLNIGATAKDDAVNIDITGNDLGALIGYHGRTLSSLQLILSLALQKKVGSWVPVVVDVGGWRSQKQEFLTDKALQIAQEVVSSQRPQRLDYLSSSERRIIHMVLADHPDVISESEGEGENRRLIIKPRTAGQ